MKIKIGARKSPLAQIQAFEVGRAIKNAFSTVEIQYFFRESQGDKIQDQLLTEFGDKGVFTEDFYLGLVNGEIEIAVHSWKDLPIEPREHTCIAGTLRRADARDLLLVKRTSTETKSLVKPFKILSSSPRREYNLKPFLTWALPMEISSVEFLPVRGNIETRLRKLFELDVDGIVVAKAALDRLLSAEGEEFKKSKDNIRSALSKCRFMVLPLSVNPAAPAQGALGIEVRRDREDLLTLLSEITDKPTYVAAKSERKILARYGGGCHQKIGVTSLPREYGEVIFLRGLTDSGEVLNTTQLKRSGPGLPHAQSPSTVWPSDTADENLFIREPSKEIPLPIERTKGLWIAKADALPKSFVMEPDRIVWVSGLTTWRKLAERGVWVSGCAESLGEGENPALDSLCPELSGWVKFTHEEGYERDNTPIISTYKLTFKDTFPDLSNFTHFFWKSGSLFTHALSRYPEIKNKWHGCGPGNTFNIVSSHLKSKEHVRVFLSKEDFLSEVMP